MKKTKAYYRKLYKRYPDMVTVEQFREMLGGIGASFASRLVRGGYVKSVFVRPSYYISKASVIEYVMSPDYASRKLKVRV